MNDMSSRSHAVFLIIVEQMSAIGDEEDNKRFNAGMPFDEGPK